LNSIASFFFMRLWLGRISTPHDLTSAGLRPLGVIPEFAQSPASTHPAGGSDDVWRAYSDAGAHLRDAAGDARALMITSPSPEEGKSTTAANLATAFARDGHRVVLVDANLRWPSLRSSDRHDASFGLTELLLNPSRDAQHALIRTGERNLYLLPAGNPPSEPIKLLGTRRLVEVLASLRDAADYVIIDAPPVLEDAGAVLLAAAADATIVVADARKTRRRRLVQVMHTLAKAGITPAGALLNRAARDETPVMPRSEPLPLAAAWANAPLLGMQPVEDAVVAGDPFIDDAVPDLALAHASAPRLRLIQPYERPLLPFGDHPVPAPEAGPSAADEDPLEITVDELLVDLEKTLSLIRDLKDKHANLQDA
jgi:capsular exopolysaccharide synthesis family protein